MAELLASDWVYESMVALLALPGLWLCWRGLLRDRARSPRCPKCWYDLRTVIVSEGANGGIAPQAVTQLRRSQIQVTLPVTCPECGRVVNTKRKLYRTRRRWLPTLCGLAALSICLYAPIVRHRVLELKETFATALVPTTFYVIALPSLDDAKLKLVGERGFVEGFLPDGLLLSDAEERFEPQLWGWQNDLLARSCTRIVFDSKGLRQEEAMKLLAQLVDAGSVQAVRAELALLKHPDANFHHAALRVLLQQQEPALSAATRPAEFGAVLAEYVMTAKDDDFRFLAGEVLSQRGRTDLMTLTDEQLVKLMEYLTQSPHFLLSSLIDAVIAEAAARPVEPVRAALANWMEVERKDQKTPGACLRLLAALRRCQGRGDPVRMSLKSPEPIVVTKGRQSYVEVTLTNVDEAGAAIGLRDVNHKNLLCWGAELRKDGQVDRRWESQVTLTSASRGLPLELGKSLNVSIELDGMWGDAEPGEYEMVVFYSSWRDPRGGAKGTPLWMIRSSAVKLIVERKK